MTHRHYVLFATILALPATLSAQVTQSKPKEPVGAKPIPYVGTKILHPSEYRDLIEHAKVYGRSVDGMHAYALPPIKGEIADALELLADTRIKGHVTGAIELLGDAHIQARVDEAMHLLQEPKIAGYKYIADAQNIAHGQAVDAFAYIRSHELSAPRQTVWYQGDPADSLYRVAQNLFSRQEYRAAASRFSDVRTRFANTRYWCDAAYYEAFSRQRLGTMDDLRTGVRVLDSMASRCSNNMPRGASADVPQLKARIDGSLARLGDADAAERVRRAAGQDQVCDTDERAVKIEALNTLANMDPATANPVLRTVLASKDPCSGPVRQQAIALVARRNDSESVATLLQIAKTETDQQVQRSAVAALSRMTNDASVAAMEDLLRNSTDERTQYEAAAAMARSDHPRAQTAVRALVERRDVAERIRLNAINALASKENLSLDYWRQMYPRVESDQLRVGIIHAIARINTDEAHAFLLSIARNPQESSEARRAAVGRIQSTAPISELYRLLESADSRSQRQPIVNAISSRKEPEATDRLIDIAKRSTDPEVRNAAIRALSQGTRKNDPKVIKALGEIISGVQ
jgi:HEAT repeat protein